MRKYFLAITLLVITSCDVNDSSKEQKPEPQQQIEKQILPDIYEQRKSIYNSFMDLADTIYRITGNDEVGRIVEFLKKNSIVITLDSECLPIPKTSPELAVFPVLASDFCPEVLEIKKRRFFLAFFNALARTLVIKGGEKLSWLSKGLVFLHEGSHALSFHQGNYSLYDIESQVKEEIRVYNLEDKILLSIGGQPFADLLEKAATQIESNVSRHGIQYLEQFNSVWDSMDKYGDRLSKIFGLSYDFEEEGVFWKSKFFISSVFYFFEKKYTGTKSTSDLKVNFIKNLPKDY